LLKKLKFIAQAQIRSLNSQIEYFAVKGIQDYENENGEIIINDEEDEDGALDDQKTF